MTHPPAGPASTRSKLRTLWDATAAPTRMAAAIICVLTLLVGVGATIYGATRQVAAGQEQHWTQVTGSVVSSSYVSGSSRRGGSSGFKRTVQYEVDGRTYTIESKVKVDDRPEIGSPVEVRYEPAEPSNGVIVGESARQGVVFIILGVAGLVLGPAIMVAILFLHGRRRAPMITSPGPRTMPGPGTPTWDPRGRTTPPRQTPGGWPSYPPSAPRIPPQSQQYGRPQQFGQSQQYGQPPQDGQPPQYGQPPQEPRNI